MKLDQQQQNQIAVNRPEKAALGDSTQYNQVTVQQALKPKCSQQSRKWQQLTDSVTYCLAKDMMPIYSVQKEGFKKLLQSFDFQYEFPSCKYFSIIAIPKLYDKSREMVAA